MQRRHGCATSGQDDIGRESDQFRRIFANALHIAPGPAGIDLHIAAIGPAQLFQALLERCDAGFCLWIIHGEWYEHAYSPHALGRLRARRDRPRRRAADQRDELAPPDHSITSSARAMSVGGTSRPSALAVVRLMTRSNLVGCSIGRSAGLVPRRILSTKSAARRFRSR